MVSADLISREHSGHAVVALGGELLLAAPQRQVLRVLSVAGLVDAPPVHTGVGDAARAAEEVRAGAPVTARPG